MYTHASLQRRVSIDAENRVLFAEMCGQKSIAHAALSLSSFGIIIWLCTHYRNEHDDDDDDDDNVRALHLCPHLIARNHIFNLTHINRFSSLSLSHSIN